MFFDLNLPGHMIAMRPSGTEPKLKFYLFANSRPSRVKMCQRPSRYYNSDCW